VTGFSDLLFSPVLVILVTLVDENEIIQVLEDLGVHNTHTLSQSPSVRSVDYTTGYTR